MALFDCSAALADQNPLTLLWEKTRANNDDLTSAEHLLEKERALLRATVGALTPQVSIGAQSSAIYDLQGSDRQHLNGRDAYARIGQTLFDSSQISQVKMQSVEVEIAETNRKDLENILLTNLALAYYEFLEKAESHRLLQNSFVGALGRLEKQSSQALKAGVRAPRDLSLNLIQIAELRLRLRQLLTETRQARLKLQQLVGEELGEIPLQEREPQLRSLPKPQVTAGERLKELQHEKKSAALAMANARFLPKVQLLGEWRESKLDSPSFSQIFGSVRDAKAFSIALSLDFPIWSGWSDVQRRNAAQQDVKASSSALAASRYRDQILTDNSPQQLEEDFAQYGEAKQLWELAKSHHELTQRQADAGFASFDSLLGPELQLVQAALLFQQSRYRYYKSEVTELARLGAFNMILNL
jgi:outer membrane protein TolC